MAPPKATSRTSRNGKENSKDPYDHSILAEPINLGVMNVAQIAACLEKGTAEMKDLILNECNIIYECRVCKNLFRSLANFLAHKRIYCKEHLCEQMVLYDPAWLPDSSNGTVVEESTHKEAEPGEEQENVAKINMSQSTFNVRLSPRPSPSKTLNIQRTSESSTSPRRVPQTGNRKRKSLASIVNDCFNRQGSPEELAKAQLNSSLNGLNFDLSKSSSSASNRPTEKKQKTVNISKAVPSKQAKAAGDNTKEYAKLFNELQEELAQIRAQTGTQLSEHEDGFGMQLLPVESLNKCYNAVGYLFNCPRCGSVCHSFSSSIHHLIESHQFSPLRAKWISFLKSSIAPSETNGNGDNSKESINHVKIVKENGQCRSISGHSGLISNTTNGDLTNGTTKMTASQAKEHETINNGKPQHQSQASAPPVSSQSDAANSVPAPKQSASKQIKVESDISKTNGTPIRKGMNGSRRTSSTNSSQEIITISSDDEDDSATTTITNGVARQMSPSLEYFKLFANIADWNEHVTKFSNLAIQFVVRHPLSLMIKWKIKAGDPSGCTECPQLLFPQQGLLLAHIALEHLNTPLMYCTLCKAFSSPNPPAMDEHMKEHHGVSTFIADLDKGHSNLGKFEASNLPSEKAATFANAPAEH